MSTHAVLASCELSGAAAKLASTLSTERPAFRSRALLFLHDAARLSEDVAALQYLQRGPLRAAHVKRLVAGASGALADAMRLHNLLSTSEIARAAAFDGAARASALMQALVAEDAPPMRAIRVETKGI